MLIRNCSAIYTDREAFLWWHLAALPVAYLLADFLSGVVHWLADTFGTPDTPLFGQRFILPFRLHHQFSEDINRRSFFDLNGDVTLAVMPLLIAGALVPPGNATMLPRILFASLAIALLPTNQIHQWAHRQRVPSFVVWLQRSGLILSPVKHVKHHTPPHSTSYCITAGWCDRILGGLIGVAHAAAFGGRSQKLNSE